MSNHGVLDIGGEPVLYDSEKVLKPDIVTVFLAQHAAQLYFGMYLGGCSREQARVLEIGIGSGAFSVAFAKATRNLVGSECEIVINGTDISNDALEIADKNLSLARGRGLIDGFDLKQTDYLADASDDSIYDVIYFNPPYLKPGTKLRDEFVGSPEVSVYTESPCQHYQVILPYIANHLSVGPFPDGGYGIARLPGDGGLSLRNDFLIDNNQLDLPQLLKPDRNDRLITYDENHWSVMNRNARFAIMQTAKVDSESSGVFLNRSFPPSDWTDNQYQNNESLTKTVL
ncbi:MAG: methyltransferase [Candidatus Nomurabacteria bacterium]|jgi:hypothetical protein|nr:methyltransferase [Candidatus Nomurabacteria bacterium]